MLASTIAIRNFQARKPAHQFRRRFATEKSKPSLLKENVGYINGSWEGAISGQTYEVLNPATGKVLGKAADMGVEETRTAITSAGQAFYRWRAKLAKERAQILKKWAHLIRENKGQLAEIATLECGKPLKEAETEVLSGANVVEWFAEEAPRIYGDIIPNPLPGRRILVVKQPIGVCGMITPWNFPSSMITRKVSAALAVGCSAVIKPAEDTPFSGLALCKLAEEAGVPPGVINVVTGSRNQAPRIGEELATNPKVRAISFTGSTAVGKLLMRMSSGTLKKVSLELGGNAPFIVFDDADLEAAVNGCIVSKFRNSGQTCVCSNRIFVQEKVYDKFVEMLTNKVKQMKQGNGMEPGVDLGPIINERGIEKIDRHVKNAIGKGARLMTGGRVNPNLGGNFFEPTVIADVRPDMLVSKEETFGPAAFVYKFQTEEEVIELSNDTEFGLAGYFYSRDVGRIWRVAEALEYGMVGVNEGLISTEVAPFGGVKESGKGREGSKYGIDEFSELKYICMGGLGERI